MPYATPAIVIIQPAPPDIRQAVSAIIARHMGEVLSRFPVADLACETLCDGRLLDAGFSAGTVFHMGPEARFTAWQMLRPDEACRDTFNRAVIATPYGPIQVAALEGRTV